MVAVLPVKEADFCSKMMLELGFHKSLGGVPLFIDKTSALHLADNRTYNPCAKQIALRYFLVYELLEEGNISIHYVKTEGQLADLGTKVRINRDLI